MHTRLSGSHDSSHTGGSQQSYFVCFRAHGVENLPANISCQVAEQLIKDRTFTAPLPTLNLKPLSGPHNMLDRLDPSYNQIATKSAAGIFQIHQPSQEPVDNAVC